MAERSIPTLMYSLARARLILGVLCLELIPCNWIKRKRKHLKNTIYFEHDCFMTCRSCENELKQLQWPYIFYKENVWKMYFEHFVKVKSIGRYEWINVQLSFTTQCPCHGSGILHVLTITMASLHCLVAIRHSYILYFTSTSSVSSWIVSTCI